MEEKELTINNLNVRYRVTGEGQPLLILHGWRSESARWQPVATELAKQNLKVVVPDLPGFGASQEPANAWNMDAYVEWLQAFSETAPELKGDFYLLGHSFGGSVAAKFCINYPQRVKKLFIVAASGIRTVTNKKKALRGLARIAKLLYFFPFYETLRRYAYKAFLRKSDYPYVSGIMKQIYLNVINEDLSQKLLFLKVPTVIIWGETDDLTPAEHAQIIHKKVENSKLILLPDIGHNIHAKNPTLLARNITENL